MTQVFKIVKVFSGDALRLYIVDTGNKNKIHSVHDDDAVAYMVLNQLNFIEDSRAYAKQRTTFIPPKKVD